ncbi:hypothetical protein MesoLj113a_71940 [Mesorhizobium sp. 113-1-2]|nr:hypothetical protein MesoLj113a_71940 [Mesorhizobium sp. 113-1-2]
MRSAWTAALAVATRRPPLPGKAAIGERRLNDADRSEPLAETQVRGGRSGVRLYQEITGRIIAELEPDTVPCVHGAGRRAALAVEECFPGARQAAAAKPCRYSPARRSSLGL